MEHAEGQTKQADFKQSLQTTLWSFQNSTRQISMDPFQQSKTTPGHKCLVSLLQEIPKEVGWQKSF